MCGIAGIVGFRAPVSPDLLAAMNSRLVHRGPDDGGQWMSADGEIGLASRRLAILDLSAAGHQPMSSPDGKLWLAFNGEIYNYVELRAELVSHGHAFRTQTDTEVVLASYAQWGEACVQKFNGMFGLAIWDSRREVLFAARDRFGEKPFYYVRLANRLVFASEIKALLADPDVPRTLDDVTVGRYLVLALVDCDDRTFFAGVRQLPVAHTLTVTRSGDVSLRRYWDLDLDRNASGDKAVVDEFRALLTDSVNIRLRSDVPVGSSLSGGLDSSGIVCTMKALLDQHPSATQKTFSARYRNSRSDEGRFIQAVVDRAGIESHNVFIEGEDLATDIDRFIWYHDEPVAHTSQFAQWKVMELARDCGVTVLLDGQGADEIIGGYPSPTFGYRYAELLTGGHVITLIRELAAFQRNHRNVGTALRYMAGALLPDSLKTFARTRLRGTAGLVSNGTGREAPRGMAPASAPQLRRALYETLTVTSLPSLLRYGDRNSMAFSREARLPFLDHRLVELAFSLPSDRLVRDGMTKVILRRALSGSIPDAVRDRTDKVGFATPERDWLAGPLRPRIEGALADLKRRGIVPSDAVDDQWAEFLAGRGLSGNVWRLANLELWMQQFIDRTSSPVAAFA
jgi:asparagine synthase (glutamine-hydrolysing)